MMMAMRDEPDLILDDRILYSRDESIITKLEQFATRQGWGDDINITTWGWMPYGLDMKDLSRSEIEVILTHAETLGYSIGDA